MSTASPANWGPCPPGELTRLAERLRFRRKLLSAAVIGGIALGVLGGTSATVWVFHSSTHSETPKYRQPHRPRTSATAGENGLVPDEGSIKKLAPKNAVIKP